MALVQQCIRLNFLPVEMSNWHQGTTKNKSIDLYYWVLLSILVPQSTQVFFCRLVLLIISLRMKADRGARIPREKKRLNLIYFILKCGPLKTSEGVQTEYSTTTEYGAFFEGKINTGWFRSAPAGVKEQLSASSEFACFFVAHFARHEPTNEPVLRQNWKCEPVCCSFASLSRIMISCDSYVRPTREQS